MNLTTSPILPLGWWIVIAIASVLFIGAWGAYARSKKKLNFSWFISVGVLFSVLGVMLNPGVVTSTGAESKPADQTGKIESSYDVYFVVDTTSSIAAEDWGDGLPRLDGVKSDVETIVSQYPNSRYTLITFDSVATMRVPITNDSSAIISTTKALQQEVTGNSRGSSVGEASEILAGTLAKNKDDDRQSIVFFFSDGEQTSNKEIESFKSSTEFISSGLVLGYGTEQGGKMKQRVGYGSPIDTYITDLAGNDGLSVIDEKNLNTIADDLGVKYLHRVAGEPLDVGANSADSVINSIDTKRYGVFGLYWVFSIVIFLLLSVAFIRVIKDIRKYGFNGDKKGLRS